MIKKSAINYDIGCDQQIDELISENSKIIKYDYSFLLHRIYFTFLCKLDLNCKYVFLVAKDIVK
jgi:hypothetical protein